MRKNTWYFKKDKLSYPFFETVSVNTTTNNTWALGQVFSNLKHEGVKIE